MRVRIKTLYFLFPRHLLHPTPDAVSLFFSAFALPTIRIPPSIPGNHCINNASLRNLQVVRCNPPTAWHKSNRKTNMATEKWCDWETILFRNWEPPLFRGGELLFAVRLGSTHPMNLQYVLHIPGGPGGSGFLTSAVAHFVSKTLRLLATFCSSVQPSVSHASNGMDSKRVAWLLTSDGE